MAEPIDLNKNKGSYPPKVDSLIENKMPIESIAENAYVKLVKDEMQKSEEGAITPKSFANSDEPEISIPKQELVQNLQAIVKDIKKNPWLAGGANYLAILWNVTDKLINLKRQTRLNEAQVAIKMTQLSIELATSIAEITRAAYADQAMEKITEAVSAGFSAGISSMQLAKVTQNIGVASKEAKVEIKKQEDIVEKLRHPTENRAADNQAPEIPAPDQKKLKAAEKTLSEMKQKKAENIRLKTQHADQIVQLGAEVQKQAVQASSNIVIAFLKLDEGQLESLKQMLENYLQLMRSYSEKASRSADEEKADIAKAIETFIRTVSDITRAHLLKS